ncbi:hypothetical protein PB2503_06922 [Parvularcula bermudensis HTCC2503]|uniref:Sel1 repeat family protein n=1 Tax=Parvularcula bermudensis (strain ATCC BAA-594 / HTCC2503 / KCTC 12087) TaxID=314260 RepID=E0TE75_PARBH|nr:tetratricopeptide repeat protein [Parvularcula bermudensis]ADM09450.1 hypothetical protein PB2503_06922 [Parvularcula bermudensis HTCC2503]
MGLKVFAMAAALTGAGLSGAVAAEASSTAPLLHTQEVMAADAAAYAHAWSQKAGIVGELTGQAIASIEAGGPVNVALLQREASYGNSDAQAALGLYHLTAKGAGFDPAAAFAYNEVAARQGMPVAQTNLGLQYLNGIGTQKNEAQAAHWFETAAIRGHDEAAYRTGMMYLAGQGVQKDPVMARYWLLKAREAGDRRAAQVLETFASF